MICSSVHILLFWLDGHISYKRVRIPYAAAFCFLPPHFGVFPLWETMRRAVVTILSGDDSKFWGCFRPSGLYRRPQAEVEYFVGSKSTLTAENVFQILVVQTRREEQHRAEPSTIISTALSGLNCGVFRHIKALGGRSL